MHVVIFMVGVLTPSNFNALEGGHESSTERSSRSTRIPWTRALATDAQARRLMMHEVPRYREEAQNPAKIILSMEHSE